MNPAPGPARRRLRIALALAVLACTTVLLVVIERDAGRAPNARPDASPTKPAASPAQTAPRAPTAHETPPAPIDREPGPTAVRAFFAAPEAPPPPEERSGLAHALHGSTADPGEDLAIVASLLSTYRDHFHELPIGTNAEITAALAGDNPHGLAPLPGDHPAISAQGELTDRWGTPYFFHQLGAGVMEVRSAGPDRRFYTADDRVHPPAEPVPAEPTDTADPG